jgi:DNA-directed RNA polymerase subunit M/transcription elongation factor TFIIS
VGKNEGFVLKCSKCGNSLEIISKDFYMEQFENDTEIKLEIDWGYEEGSIVCECGNVVIF